MEPLIPKKKLSVGDKLLVLLELIVLMLTLLIVAAHSRFSILTALEMPTRLGHIVFNLNIISLVLGWVTISAIVKEKSLGIFTATAQTVLILLAFYWTSSRGAIHTMTLIFSILVTILYIIFTAKRNRVTQAKNVKNFDT